MFKVELFNKNGEVYSNNLKWNTNISSLNTNTLLQANSTALFCLDVASTSSNFGYGKIITSGINGHEANGLVIANGFGYKFSKDLRNFQIQINNGLPF